MRSFLQSILIPVTVVVFTALYWFHTKDAPSAATRVPNGVMLFTLVMAMFVALGEIKAGRQRSQLETSQSEPRCSFWIEWRLQILFIVAAIIYFVCFSSIGFNFANFIFLLLSFRIAGFGKKEARTPYLKMVLSALLATVIFWALAHIMDFNVPVSPLGF